MRYDTPIYFRKTVSGAYNPDTANYAEDTPIEDKQYASVTDTGIKTLKLVYNELKQGSLTIRLQVPYTKEFETIRVGEKIYKSDFTRRHKTFVLSEVR